jgi:hypothetical protein
VAAAHPDLALAEADLRPAIQAARLAQSDDVSEALEVEEREGAARIGNIGLR